MTCVERDWRLTFRSPENPLIVLSGRSARIVLTAPSFVSIMPITEMSSSRLMAKSSQFQGSRKYDAGLVGAIPKTMSLTTTFKGARCVVRLSLPGKVATKRDQVYLKVECDRKNN